MRRKIPKPYNEKSLAEKIAEHEGAIYRLELTMSQGDNRYGEYGRNCREAVEHHKASLARLNAPTDSAFNYDLSKAGAS